MKRRAIYYRVSTKKQETESQVEALREYFEQNGLDFSEAVSYTDKVSGAVVYREGLNQLIADMAKNQISEVYLYKMDRLSRAGSEHVISFLSFAANSGVKVVFTHDPFLNTEDRMMRIVMTTIMAELARKERDHIVQRVRAGLRARRSKGIKLGPSLKFKGSDVRDMMRLHESDVPVTEICRRYKMSRQNFYRLLKIRAVIELLDGGMTPEEAAVEFDVPVREVENWIKAYGSIFAGVSA